MAVSPWLTFEALREQQANTKTKLTDPIVDFYVDPAGDNSNDGLTPATAWEGIQYALENVAENYDLFNVEVRINLADGTYPTDIIRIPRFNTSANNFACQLYLKGNVTNPENVIIDFSASTSTSAVRFNVKWVNDARLCLGGVTLRNNDISKEILALTDQSYLNIIAPVIFEGDCRYVTRVVDNSLLIISSAGDITINSMTTDSVFRSGNGGIIKNFAPTTIPAGQTITMTNPTQGFCTAFNQGIYVSNQTTITNNGTVTGVRYSVNESTIDLFGAFGLAIPPSTYFPGDTDGRILDRKYGGLIVLGPYADDTAAAAAGIEIGQMYHTAAGDLKIRLV